MTKLNKKILIGGIFSFAFFLFTTVLLFKTSALDILDNRINSFFITIQNSFISDLMNILDVITGEMIFAGLVILLSSVFLYKRSRKESLTLLGSVFVGGVAVKLLKDFFEVTRPNVLLGDVVSSFSFPSGHATLSVTFFIVAVYLFCVQTTNVSRQKIVIAGAGIITFLILFNRLYLGLHWFSDVLAGAFLGATIALISLYIYRK